MKGKERSIPYYSAKYLLNGTSVPQSWFFPPIFVEFMAESYEEQERLESQKDCKRGSAKLGNAFFHSCNGTSPQPYIFSMRIFETNIPFSHILPFLILNPQMIMVSTPTFILFFFCFFSVLVNFLCLNVTWQAKSKVGHAIQAQSLILKLDSKELAHL